MALGPTDRVAARTLHEANLIDAQHRQDTWLATITSNVLATIAIAEKDFERARGHLETSLPAALSSGELSLIAFAHLAGAAVALNDHITDDHATELQTEHHTSHKTGHRLGLADAHLRAALRAVQRIPLPPPLAVCLEGFAAIQAQRGQLLRAAHLWGQPTPTAEPSTSQRASSISSLRHSSSRSERNSIRWSSQKPSKRGMV